ncbi:MAG: 30S ribosomal protein S8 [Deltaproteobacteria bacterium]|nr:30S ribosomal protein S8 [Deltaproteobacteria bacterium]
MTDPIADFLTRIRNAYRARKERVDIPWSNVKERLAAVLVEEGYLKDSAVTGEGTEKQIRLSLRYDARRQPVITGIQRVSRPSLRVYVGAESAPRIRRGMGVSILSTPRGILADHQARKQHVGGEVLCAVW